MSLWQSARALAACAALTIVPLVSQAAVVIPQDRDKNYGPILFHPNSITVAMSLLKPGMATFRVSQHVSGGGWYNGRFRGRIQCGLGLLGKPRLHIDGHTVIVYVPPQRVVLSVGCYATMVGGGGVTGQEPILIDVGL
jgi:hypothetical protein